MNEDALDAMIYAWYTLEEKRRRKMIDYTDFGRIIDIKTFTEGFGEDHKIVITFSLSGQVYPEKLANASYTLNRIRSYPDNYVVCDIGEIIRAKQMETADREEIIKLKRENEKLKELNKSIVDRNNRLAAECTDYEEKIEDLNKDLEDLNKDLENSKHLSRFKSELIYEKNQRIKELESDRTARVTINPNGSLTFSRDGKSETVLMPVEEDPTKCVHYRGSGICYGCSMNTLSFRRADNQHPCKEYKKKKE